MGGSSSKQSIVERRTPRVPEFRLKAILVGSPFSGRSCVFERYISNKFSYDTDVSPSALRLGTKVWLLSDPSGGVAFLNLWDTPRQITEETGGPGFWSGAKLIFVCVSGTEVSSVETEVVKWCTASVVRRAHEKDKAIVCILITKSDTLKEEQQDQIKRTMNRLVECPGLAFDTWAFCSAKETKGIQCAEDVLKVLFFQYVKEDARRQRREQKTSRRSLIATVTEKQSLRESLVSLANQTYKGPGETE